MDKSGWCWLAHIQVLEDGFLPSQAFLKHQNGRKVQGQKEVVEEKNNGNVVIKNMSTNLEIQ